jgi:5-oxoprolinase (ATP-hydrolysing)
MLVDTIITCEGDRHESDPPWGIFGGQDGLNASVIVNRGEPDEQSWPAKVTGKILRKNGTIQITVPSSGGYGDPLNRVPEQVLSDVLDEFTTLELARRDYGVAINPLTMTIDAAATEALRVGLRKQKQPGGEAARDLELA